MVCEEADNTSHAPAETMSHSDKSMRHTNHAHTPASGSKIVLRILNNGNVDEKEELTEGRYPAHHAVVAAIDKGLLIAWVKEQKGHSGISYSFIRTD